MWLDTCKKQNKQTFIVLEDDLNAEWQDAVSDESNSKLAEKVFNELAEHCKQILTLFYIQAKKMSEIMQLMNYNSENTAKTQKYKCLEGAKNKLKEYSQTQTNLL
jgi:DNA-directed RNA polymerase specialized sigma24 family protein